MTARTHYYLTGDESLVSADRRTTIMPLVIPEGAREEIDQVHQIVDEANGSGSFQVLVTGEATLEVEINEIAEKDLLMGEGIGISAALQAGAVAMLAATFLLGLQAAPASAKPLDSDGDGCTDAQEFGPQVSLGGQRNPNNFWDFFDVPVGELPRNQAVDAFDIGAVVLRFGAFVEPPPTKTEALAQALSAPADMTSYHAAYDRGGPIPGQNLWNLLAPDGAINAFDIGAVVVQFGHTCWHETPTPADSTTLASEMGAPPVFWRPQDEEFQSLRAGEPYKVVIRITSGYEEESVRIVAEPESGLASAVEFDVLGAEPIGEEAPGSYYPLSLELPQPGTWVLTVLAGDVEVSLTVEAASSG